MPFRQVLQQATRWTDCPRCNFTMLDQRSGEGGSDAEDIRGDDGSTACAWSSCALLGMLVVRTARKWIITIDRTTLDINLPLTADVIELINKEACIAWWRQPV